MSKGPWKKQRKPKVDLTFGTRENGATETVEPIKPEVVQEGPAPLPPIGGEGDPFAAGGKVVFDESKIKAGLGKGFCTVTAGAARLINFGIRKSPYRVDFVDITPEEGDLWAEFAFPVLKMYLPNLEQSPVTTLCVMTGLILSGKIKVTKLEIKNVRNEDSTSQA